MAAWMVKYQVTQRFISICAVPDVITADSERICQKWRSPATYQLALNVSLLARAFDRVLAQCAGSQNSSEMAHGDTPKL
jgi:hypothetical protein